MRHDDAQILQALRLAGKYRFQLCVRFILTDIVERRYISRQTGQRRSHFVRLLLTESKCLRHSSEGSCELLRHRLRQSKLSCGILCKLIDLLIHSREHNVDDVLDLRKVGSEFNALCSKIYNLLYSKRGCQGGTCFLCKCLDPCHLLLKCSFIDDQIQPDLTNTVSRHTYHLPFKTGTSAQRLRFLIQIFFYSLYSCT